MILQHPILAYGKAAYIAWSDVMYANLLADGTPVTDAQKADSIERTWNEMVADKSQARTVFAWCEAGRSGGVLGESKDDLRV